MVKCNIKTKLNSLSKPNINLTELSLNVVYKNEYGWDNQKIMDVFDIMQRSIPHY